ncbi:MAG: hypothetical protein AB2809_23195 [Candidatus Thiodiazotropha sp.]
MRKRCLSNEAQHIPRQINVTLDITQEQKAGILEWMKRKLDSPRGRYIYSLRLQWKRCLVILPVPSASSDSVKEAKEKLTVNGN